MLSNFTETLFFKKNITTPCYQFLSLKSGLTAWILRTVVARAPLPLLAIIFTITLVPELHPAAVLCHHQVPVNLCISLYIYLSDTLDEQRSLLCPSEI